MTNREWRWTAVPKLTCQSKGMLASRLLNYQKTNANGGLNLLLSANEFRENPILSIISLIFNKHPKDDDA